VIVCRLDLPASRQPRADNAKFGNQFLDYLCRFMRDLVHAFRHRPAVGRVDAAEGLTKFRGDDAAIAAARPQPGRLASRMIGVSPLLAM